MFVCNDDNNLSSVLLLPPYDHNFFLTKYFLRIMFSEIVNKLCPLLSVFPKIIVLPVIKCMYIFLHGTTAPSGSGPPHFRRFAITLGHTTLGRTPLGEWSARRTDLYLTTHNTYKTGSHPRFRRDSNPQFQQASGRRPTPKTARPRGSAVYLEGVATQFTCLLSVSGLGRLTSSMRQVGDQGRCGLGWRNLTSDLVGNVCQPAAWVLYWLRCLD